VKTLITTVEQSNLKVRAAHSSSSDLLLGGSDRRRGGDRLAERLPLMSPAVDNQMLMHVIVCNGSSLAPTPRYCGTGRAVLTVVSGHAPRRLLADSADDKNASGHNHHVAGRDLAGVFSSRGE
jgi:hypothetical protein